MELFPTGLRSTYITIRLILSIVEQKCILLSLKVNSQLTNFYFQKAILNNVFVSLPCSVKLYAFETIGEEIETVIFK